MPATPVSPIQPPPASDIDIPSPSSAATPGPRSPSPDLLTPSCADADDDGHKRKQGQERKQQQEEGASQDEPAQGLQALVDGFHRLLKQAITPQSEYNAESPKRQRATEAEDAQESEQCCKSAQSQDDHTTHDVLIEPVGTHAPASDIKEKQKNKRRPAWLSLRRRPASTAPSVYSDADADTACTSRSRSSSDASSASTALTGDKVKACEEYHISHSSYAAISTPQTGPSPAPNTPLQRSTVSTPDTAASRVLIPASPETDSVRHSQASTPAQTPRYSSDGSDYAYSPQSQQSQPRSTWSGKHASSPDVSTTARSPVTTSIGTPRSSAFRHGKDSPVSWASSTSSACPAATQR